MKCLVLFCVLPFALIAGESFIVTHAPQFYDGGEFPGAKGSAERKGEAVLTHFDFTGGGHYVETAFDLKPAQFLKAVTFTAKRPGGYLLTIRMTDSTGQTFQKTVNHTSDEPQVYRFNTEGWTGHWGGADDGVVCQPVKRFSILVENAHLPNAAGDLELRDISVMELPENERTAASAHRQCTRYLVTDFGATDVDAVERRSFGVGNGSLDRGVLRADFSKTDTVSLSHSLSIFGKPVTLLLTVEADRAAEGAEVEMDIGSQFQTFRRVIGTFAAPVLKSGLICQTFAVPAPPDRSWSHSGGDNNGAAAYPLRLNCLRVKRANAAAKPVAIRLVSLEAETFLTGSRTVVRTRLAGEPAVHPVLLANIRNLDGEAVGGTLTLVIRNWEGDELSRKTTELPTAILPGQDVSLEFPLDAPPKGVNFLSYEATFKPSVGDTVSEWTSTWTARLADEGPSALAPESPWGMGVYLYRNGNDEAGYKRMEAVAAKAQAAGVKWSREEFQWNRLEPQKGQFDFAFYDRLLDTAARHGISVYALFAYWTGWTKPYTEDGYRDYCEGLRAVVRHYKGRIHHWEIYNEPNISFWTGPKEGYPVLLKMAYEAVKAEDPTAQVLGCSTSGIDTNFIQMCLDTKAPMDALTIHPYRGYLQVQSFVDELARTRAQVGGRPVWITEMGWPTVPDRVTEREQASLLARTYLSAAPSVSSVCWYDFVNDGWNTYYTEENFGIQQNDLSPKPAYRALATVCRTFDSGKPALRAIPCGGATLYLFTMGGKSAVWAECESRVALSVASESPNLTARNLMAEPLALKRENGRWQCFTDSKHPVFFDSVVSDASCTALHESSSLEIVSF